VFPALLSHGAEAASIRPAEHPREAKSRAAANFEIDKPPEIWKASLLKVP
jgi:hypothetical protein